MDFQPCLTVNCGSSSIKIAMFANQTGDRQDRILQANIDRVGSVSSRLQLQWGTEPSIVQAVEAGDHARGMSHLLAAIGPEWLTSRLAIGHRVVHGGPRYWQTTRIDEQVLNDLTSCIPLAPAHLPGELAVMRMLAERLPDTPQFACFDTAFHHQLPPTASRLPLRRRYAAEGIRRYGFHGLSYAYLYEELVHLTEGTAANERIVLAHLGAGCSLAAVLHGRCIDTTMGFTPTAGVMMARRSGDLDPGVLLYLLRNHALTVDDLDRLLNEQSGLLGVSEISADTRDLLAAETSDVRAREALDLFCYQVRKTIGALAAALGGLDRLVFSAGIGENSAKIRERICQGLEYLGIALNPACNEQSAPLISTGQVPVHVLHTDEEVMIAREVARQLQGV